MKCLVTILLFSFFTVSLFAQAPDLMTYQMVVRDNSGNIVAGSSVGLRLSILQGSASGAEVFAETHSVATNSNGLLSLLIGGGTNVSGSIAAINWAAGPYFLRAQTDPSGGTNYTLENISQLVSVPYSLYSMEAQSAQSAGNGFSHVSETGDTLYFLNGSFVIIPGISGANGGTGEILGCTSNTACNYNSSATQDDGSCYFIGSACNDGDDFTINDVYNLNCACEGQLVVPGCTSNTACNYNSSATQDDGSCYFVGDFCDDNNPSTTDSVGTDCSCVGFVPEGLGYELGNGITDVDGNSYSTIRVEGVEWMVEDLRAVCFSNGDSIMNTQSNQSWQTSSDIGAAAWSWYNNDAIAGATYGRLYNGYAVSDERNVCPTGWHVPTSAEWKSYLIATGDTLDGFNLFGFGLESATGGIEMKDPSFWGDDEITNSTGFSGRPGGKRDSLGNFIEQGEKGFWWCKDGDPAQPNTLGARKLVQGSDSLYRFDADKGWGMNIRCREDVIVIDTATMHTCGAPNVHNPNLTYGSMTDQEGNTYKTIAIGTQEWMAENLNTSIYRNGDSILTDLDDATWSTADSGAWAYYNNDSSYACPYGKLYNWYACVDPRGLCPTGWHVPSDEEWSTMINYIDPSADGGNTYPNVAGIAMKSAGTIEGGDGYWQFYDSSVEGTNSSGFSGLPGAYRYYDGDYNLMGYYGYWWSSTQSDSNYSWYLQLGYNNANVLRYNFPTLTGWGVRCLRD